MKKIRLRIIITSLFSIFVISLLFIGNSLSILTVKEVDENLNYYSTANLDISYSTNHGSVILNNSYPLSYSDALKIEPYRITIYNNGNIGYKFNLIINDKTTTNNISYKYLNVKIGNEPPFKMSDIKNNIIKSDMYVSANGSVSVDIFVWLDEKTPNSEIGRGFYANISIDGIAISDSNLVNKNYIYNLDISGANKPVLKDDMIPVYYDYSTNNWKKADINNVDSLYQWYDYGNKMWANVVFVKNDYISKYRNSTNGTIIDDNDIVSFYVWIPRFKYKVININRSVVNSYGSNISIMYENGFNKSNMIKCTYNYLVSNSLADECIVDNNKISVNSDNSFYSNVWYTHPAFTYDNNELEGFWIGKFETTGSIDNPTILPDRVSMTGENIGDFIKASMSINKDARIIRNIEWGSVAYLSNSVYGNCSLSDSDVVCNKYNNNSSLYYTGSGSNENGISKYGTYNYQGFLIDSNSSDRVITKEKRNVFASSTLNIYGVYDLYGGAMEYTLGSGKKLDIDRKYYDLYFVSDAESNLLNSILGDGTVEYGILGNKFIDKKNYLFVRGNSYNEDSNVFMYSASDGSKNEKYTFRSVIS